MSKNATKIEFVPQDVENRFANNFLEPAQDTSFQEAGIILEFQCPLTFRSKSSRKFAKWWLLRSPSLFGLACIAHDSSQIECHYWFRNQFL